MPSDVDAEVLSNVRLSDEYNVVTLAAPGVAGAARPGQFVMVKPSLGLDPLLRRPFSIFEILRDTADAPIAISLLNKRVGVSTGSIFALAPGARVACLGPLGLPFTPADPPAEAWMIAGGVGLAPFATLAEALARRGTRTTLFYGGRRSDDLYYTHVFERLNARLILTTEDGTRGEHGRITAPLERALRGRRDGTPVVLYACGPTGMMRATAALAARYGCPLQVSLEQTMGCGLGGCYSCVVPVRHDDGTSGYVRSCLSGPVFAADRVEWERLTH